MENKLGDLILPDYSRHMTKPKVIRLADSEIAMTQINLNQKRSKRNKRKKIQLSQKVLQQNKHKTKTEVLAQLVMLEVMPVMDVI